MRLIGLPVGFLLATSNPLSTSDGAGVCYGFQGSTQRPLRRPRQQKPTNTALQNSKQHSPKLCSSFRTALCIIPPDESWDTLQRARHFAQDRSYHQWPPAIRLFYPFCDRKDMSDLALDIAAVVEKHNIEPFRIKLSQWTVMPLPMDLKEMLEEPAVAEDDDDSPTLVKNPEEQAVLDLIADEERKGVERKSQRELRIKMKRRQKALEQGLELEIMANSTSQSATALRPKVEEKPVKHRKSKKNKNKEEELQASPFDEFNGPAMIALEPDNESIRKLKRLRELLRQEMEGEADPSIPSRLWDSPVPLYNDQEEEDFERFVDDITDFRPLIPMGAFPTIDSALAMARKLKGLWEPLTFDVTDFHFLSQPPVRSEQKTAEQKTADETQAYYNDFNPNIFTPQKKQGNAKPETTTRPRAPFGCDALVFLMGEEIEQDETANELMAQFVFKEGLPGGYERRGDDVPEKEQPEVLAEDEDDSTRQNHMRLFEDLERQLNAKEGDIEELLDWLEEDEEEDGLELGTTVVIGRTHFFSGEARLYDCMPASTSCDDEQANFGIGSSPLI